MSDLLALNVLRTHGHRRGQKGPTQISSVACQGRNEDGQWGTISRESNDCEGCQKVQMSQVISSIQYICFRQTSGSNRLLAPGAISPRYAPACRFVVCEAVSSAKYSCSKPCSGILDSAPPWVFFLCWFYVLRKMLETCASMTFPDFQRQM